MSTLRVEVDCPPQDLEQAVDGDIAQFDKFFQELGNDPVVRSEKAIIKTYLHWKVRGGATNGEASGS